MPVVKRIASFVLTCIACAACARTPTPLVPVREGSIGVPHLGVLTAGSELPRSNTLRWLRDDDRHWAIPRFNDAIARAGAAVANARPGSPPLTVGDLSIRTGGVLLPHFSHRNGRDADLLLYVTTLEGAPVPSPGFVHFGADGIGYDEKYGRWLRFDVEREWLLVKALVEDEDARVQWIFANHVIEGLVIEWAIARGEPAETIWRAEQVLLEPNPGGAHDDHVHVRTACTDDEIAYGCEPNGPMREWFAAPLPDREDDETLVADLLRPIESTTAGASTPVTASGAAPGAGTSGPSSASSAP